MRPIGDQGQIAEGFADDVRVGANVDDTNGPAGFGGNGLGGGSKRLEHAGNMGGAENAQREFVVFEPEAGAGFRAADRLAGMLEPTGRWYTSPRQKWLRCSSVQG